MHAFAHHCYPCESTLLWRWPRSLQGLWSWLCCLHIDTREDGVRWNRFRRKSRWKTITSITCSWLFIQKKENHGIRRTCNKQDEKQTEIHSMTRGHNPLNKSRFNHYRISPSMAQRFHKAPHACSSTSLSSLWVDIAVMMASIPPRLAILTWLSAYMGE